MTSSRSDTCERILTADFGADYVNRKKLCEENPFAGFTMDFDSLYLKGTFHICVISDFLFSRRNRKQKIAAVPGTFHDGHQQYPTNLIDYNGVCRVSVMVFVI